MKIEKPSDIRDIQELMTSRDGRIARRVMVCAGTGCVASGSLDVYKELVRLSKEAGLPVTVTFDKHEHKKDDSNEELYIAKSGCHGFCQMGPLVHVMPDDILYCKVKAADAEEIVQNTLTTGEAVERLLYTDPVSGEHRRGRGDIPFYAGQSRVVLGRCGVMDPESIGEYIASGGFEGLAKCLSKYSPEQVAEEMVESGLRGRGGAGFPTGIKWRFANREKADKKYVICNGDEGDPGAFMDRSLMEGDPFAVLEGLATAAYAIGAQFGYLYIRQEYPLAIARVQKAIETMREVGLLGEHIMGTDFSFDCKIKKGAGAFVCGEETALIHSIEGKRGEPRPRPPFPAQSGAFGKPTIINNVETLVNIPSIMAKGASWYNAVGTESSKGTKVFALTGKINRTGLVEVAMGTTVRKIIEEIGGGIQGGKAFKAVQMGGPSGGCVDAAHMDIEIDYESLKAVGAMMGSGGMVVMDEDNCIVDVAKFFMDFIQRESCGKCVPCRIGTKRMLEMLTQITENDFTDQEAGELIGKLEAQAQVTQDASLCGLGQTAPNPVLSTLRWFREEYEAHLHQRTCPAKVCNKLLTFSIDAETCIGCSICAKRCPVEAIVGEKKKPHEIIEAKCIKCGSCFTVCPKGAVVAQ